MASPWKRTQLWRRKDTETEEFLIFYRAIFGSSILTLNVLWSQCARYRIYGKLIGCNTHLKWHCLSLQLKQEIFALTGHFKPPDGIFQHTKAARNVSCLWDDRMGQFYSFFEQIPGINCTGRWCRIWRISESEKLFRTGYKWSFFHRTPIVRFYLDATRIYIYWLSREEKKSAIYVFDLLESTGIPLLSRKNIQCE